MLIEKKFLKAVKEFNLLNKNDSVLIAFSGGVDSTVLTHLFLKFKNYLQISKIVLVHLNHCLRGKDSDLDEKFAVDFAQNKGLKIYTKRIDIKKLAQEKKKSLEEVAREERYSFFREIKEKENLDWIATGHHLSDLTETMILWFIQGNKKGIKGFKPKDRDVIRPLFLCKKDEIQKYADEKNIPYRTDITNFQTDYLRNKIRHILLPEVKKINPSVEESLLTMSFFLNWDDDFLEKQAGSISQSFPEDYIELKHLKDLPYAIVYRVLRNWIYSKTGVFPSYRQLYVITKLVHEDKGYKEFYIGSKYLLTRTGQKLKIKRYNKRDISFSYKLKAGDEVLIKETGVKIKSSVLDAKNIEKYIFNDKNFVCFDLPENSVFEIRNRKKGDRFLPFGRSSEKKLKDVMIDLKIPKDMRDTIPLLTYGNKILWIVGYKRSGYFPVEKNSKKIVCFELKEV